MDITGFYKNNEYVKWKESKFDYEKPYHLLGHDLRIIGEDYGKPGDKRVKLSCSPNCCMPPKGIEITVNEAELKLMEKK
jgi:hypothetical protein